MCSLALGSTSMPQTGSLTVWVVVAGCSWVWLLMPHHTPGGYKVKRFGRLSCARPMTPSRPAAAPPRLHTNRASRAHRTHDGAGSRGLRTSSPSPPSRRADLGARRRACPASPDQTTLRATAASGRSRHAAHRESSAPSTSTCSWSATPRISNRCDIMTAPMWCPTMSCKNTRSSRSPDRPVRSRIIGW